MKRFLAVALALSIVEGLAASAGAQSWEVALNNVRSASVHNAAKRPAKKPVRTKQQGPPKVTDAATWQALLSRAESRPSRVQTTRIGTTVYKQSIVTIKTALRGQDCPQGTAPVNSLFVTK